LRLIQQPGADRINAVGEETSQDELFYPTELPATFDADGRNAAANTVIRAFSEAGTDVKAYCAGADEKKVSFVFYAGTEEGCSEAVLDILKTYGIRSTFFVSHYYAAHSSDRVKQLLADGHELGNYSYSCPQGGIIAGRSLADVVSDAINEHNYIRAAYNTELQKYSFPAGAYSLAAGRLLAEAGYEVCFPDILLDDNDPEKTYDRAALFSSLKASLHPGAVYAFHLENGIAADVLIDLISYATAQGYVIAQFD
ncbi:MAG: polysaccharide deacetylase family protein, partial [Lachnospiraceae bacterium]|nr:polysaccharide deacetylase family protein [Lachnospiraceae bacterium]